MRYISGNRCHNYSYSYLHNYNIRRGPRWHCLSCGLLPWFPFEDVAKVHCPGFVRVPSLCALGNKF